MLSDKIKKLKPGQKLVFVPPTIQALMCGIVAVELHPDNTYTRVYENGTRVIAAMTPDHLSMDEDNFNIFKFAD